MWVDAVRRTMERQPAFDRFALGRPLRHGLAVAFTGLAVLVRLGIAPPGAGIPFITFFPAVALSAIVGGLWPGLLSAALGVALALWLFMPPFGDPHFGALRIVVFLGQSVLVCTAIEAMHFYYRDYTRVARDLVRERGEAEEARCAAEVANRCKSDFLTNMSHELRTPLNAIIGFSDTILAQPFGALAPKYAEYAADIHESGQLLLALINDMLAMSAIEANKLTLHEESFDLGEAIASCLRMIRPRAEQGGVAVVQAVPPLPAVHADRRRIVQIVLNLLSNAVKFTPVGGTVTVAAEVGASGGLVVAVADIGIGMDEAGIARALQPFGQVRNSLQKAHEGTGLGLPVSRSLAQLHGGDLVIESRVGRGTTVRLCLPSWRVVAGESRSGVVEAMAHQPAPIPNW
jgi:signal transduction histidine kinase